ncbi:MAG: pilus assembly protein [Caldilineaceae bacterium]
MLNHVTDKLKNERGSTLIEFAAVLTILLSLTFAMVDFGRYVYANNVIRAAAQEGARVGLIDGTDDATIVEATKGKLLTLDATKATVVPTHNGSTVNVNVTYEFEFITPFIDAVAGGAIQLSGTASMLRFPA